VLLVVAADDGVMPQTREHLAILDLLGVSRGAIVITKIDRVGTGRAAEVEAQARALVAGTTLADAPAFAVSALDGLGIDALRDHLARAGARLDALFACTDAPGPPSTHRKPAPGMLLDALRRFRVAPADAVMIGDSLRDLEAAARAGTARMLVRTGHGAATQAAGLPAPVLPVGVHADLAAAVSALLGPER